MQSLYDSYHIKPRKIIFEHNPENDHRFTSKELSIMNLQTENGTSNRLDVWKRQANGEGKIEDIKQADIDFEAGMDKVRNLYSKKLDKALNSENPVMQKAIVDYYTNTINKGKEKILNQKEEYKRNITNKQPIIRKAFEDSINDAELLKDTKPMNEKLRTFSKSEIVKNNAINRMKTLVPLNQNDKTMINNNDIPFKTDSTDKTKNQKPKH